jgi:hypothetical protein
VLSAAFEREGAAEQLGRGASPTRFEAELCVDGIRRQQVVEPRRRAVGGVAEPVDVAVREDDEVARPEARLLGVVCDLQPAGADGDDVEGSQAVRLDAEAPGSAQRRSAEDGAGDAQVPEQGVDLVRRGRARQQFRQRGPPWRLAGSR